MKHTQDSEEVDKENTSRCALASTTVENDYRSTSNSLFSIDDGDSDEDYDAHDEKEVINSKSDENLIIETNGNSLPNPDTIARAERKSKLKGNKTLETIAGVAGNVLEWYDFAVFGYFSDVIAKVFFPPQDGDKAIVETFVVFGLAFLCRPIGGVLMGYIGDTYGRKRALEISIFLMAFPTFAMGCLPSYDRVGRWAVVFLTLVRMLQGLSVGGQLVSSLVFTLENNPKQHWGLYGSYVMAAANFGTLLGDIVSTFMRAKLTDEQLLIWGWRLPFLSGIVVSFCGLYLKYFCDEDSIDHHHGGGGGSVTINGEKVNPIKAAFARKNLRSLAAASFVPMLWSAGFYITFVWMATFMSTLIEKPVPGAFGVNAVALFVSVCMLFPLSGILSDIFGRSRVMFVGGIAMAILSPIMVSIISTGNAVAAFFAQSAMGISLSLWGAPMCAWLVESFPREMRLTSVAVGYNIAQALIGGNAPALATYLVEKYGPQSPGFMVSCIAILSVTGLCIAPSRSDTDDFQQVTQEQTELNQKEPESFISYSDDEEDGISYDDEDRRETELI